MLACNTKSFANACTGSPFLLLVSIFGRTYKVLTYVSEFVTQGLCDQSWTNFTGHTGKWLFKCSLNLKFWKRNHASGKISNWAFTVTYVLKMWDSAFAVILLYLKECSYFLGCQSLIWLVLISNHLSARP